MLIIIIKGTYRNNMINSIKIEKKNCKRVIKPMQTNGFNILTRLISFSPCN